MSVVTEPRKKDEIQRIESLIKQLDTLHSEARGLQDDDLRASVTTSLDDLIKTLGDERRKMRLQLGSLGLALP